MTTQLTKTNFAALSLKDEEVTEVYAYYYLWPGGCMLSADICLVRGEDDKYGFMPGNAMHIPEHEKVVLYTRIEEELCEKKYRVVMVQLPERTLTHREEARPEQWRMFESFEIKCNIFNNFMLSQETIKLLTMYFESSQDEGY